MTRAIWRGQTIAEGDEPQVVDGTPCAAPRAAGASAWDGAGLVAVVPAVDEEGSVAGVVAGLLRGGVERVIVVDNGSSDRTAELAREAGAQVVVAPRRGYGSACRAALAVLPAGTRAVVFCDADGADDLRSLDAIVRPVLRDEADLVIGSRVLGRAERGALTAPQRAGNLVAAALLRLLFGARVTDLGPFRAISVEALCRLDMRDPAFGWTAEMQTKALRLGLRVVEVPVDAHARRTGVSKISGRPSAVLRAGWAILTTIVRHRFTAPTHAGDRGAARATVPPTEPSKEAACHRV
ncbi:MAG: glycosyltransferase [Myxococcales bacterium]|nr:glycosyltransferase [Myxococcales bacterium]